MHNGNPWQSANKNEINYAVFIEGWQAFLDTVKDTPIDENNFPQCGPIFNSLSSNSQRRCVLKMLHPNPESRCTIADALNDRWIKHIDCCSPEPKEMNGVNGNGLD
ncbi:MAG: hypothetical protein M1823_007962, partial [Watsoniomyces obsoletus]